jgi:hypothetical protein
MDHLHHRGIFWSWHQLLRDGLSIADPWMCDRIQWNVVWTETTITHEEAILKAEVHWVITDSTAENTNHPIIKEEVRVQVSFPESGIYIMDFTIGLKALERGLSLGGSNDDKGYGGFSVRLRLPDDVEFRGVGGKVTPQNTPVEAGKWMDVRGSYNKQGSEKQSVIIHAIPSSLPSFRGWILRKSGSMQNPAFPGKRPIPLDTEHPILIRHRLVISDHLLSDVQAQKLQEDFEDRMD